jgi:hypothetical protein
MRQVYTICRDLGNTLVFQVRSVCKHCQYCNQHMSLLRSVVAATNSTRVYGDLTQMSAPFSSLLPSSKSTFREQRSTGNEIHISKKHVMDSCT